MAEQAHILKAYGLSRVTGDKYAGSWPSDEFQKHGISYVDADRDKSKIYLDSLPLVMSGNVELLDNKHLFNELRSLERKTRSGGRDTVDHPPRGHDDLANAVAGAATLVGGQQKMVRILTKSLRGRPQPKEPEPLHPRLQIKTQEIPCGKED
ncbi:MAG: hypothetical protein KJ822_17570 [Proteobacteria bacterium]|nr:hypothetical protein [Pseudomonadota bacterium]